MEVFTSVTADVQINASRWHCRIATNIHVTPNDASDYIHVHLYVASLLTAVCLLICL